MCQLGFTDVPEGTQTTKFSRRVIHSKVRSAYWAGRGIEDAVGSQASKVYRSGSLWLCGARRAWTAPCLRFPGDEGIDDIPSYTSATARKGQ